MSLASEKIERCSAQMLLSYPWWASLYLHLVRIETEAVDTMAVDGTHLFYNPRFTESLSDKECVGVLMHEPRTARSCTAIAGSTESLSDGTSPATRP